MGTDHYFSAEPAGRERRRTISTVLGGRTVEVCTANGTFSPDHVDTGTRVLLDTVPAPPPGATLADIGCGWGPIALSAALLEPTATIWAVDVNTRAVQLTVDNAASLSVNVNAGVPEEIPPELTFDLIWSNPPIRIGKAQLHELLLTWLPRLTLGGSAWLVVAKKLGAESLQRWLADSLPGEFAVDKVTIAKGFRVIRATRNG
ncbi:class I SAM-dependent methyltransferase [Spelaeicoccus albus]|uniref:16S rRNA G1207 methylase RsmC n=1 Tax=Spelaeicoccus albus TaxID=1280376 RepID=A0A7Z0D2T3_9MICO|nr:methyltransferase [Spelaeicoccus albus]NYI67827.1 16S rRNA G1207 methylase RsmC [Spelaeicoccus albus]